MIVDTTRFGPISIEEDKLITMRGPILGFERLRQYFLFHEGGNTPFRWFQSVQDASVAFVVVDPFAVKPDYEPDIPAGDMALLEIDSNEDGVLLAIATLFAEPPRITVNLRAPILIHAERKLGKQVVLEKPDHAIRHSVSDHEMHALMATDIPSSLAVAMRGN